jgi:LacI family transcriptional regulator
MAVPPLTTVRSRAYELGQAAAGTILSRLEIGRFKKRDNVFPLELVEGRSILAEG